MGGRPGTTMAFPRSISAPIDGGFEGYVVDCRRNTSAYFLPDGNGVSLENRTSSTRVAEDVDQDGVIAQINWAQASRPKQPGASFRNTRETRSAAPGASYHSSVAGVFISAHR